MNFYNKRSKRRDKYKINAKDKKAEILIYDTIGEGWLGGLSAKRFAEDVKALGKVDEINVRINSDGGSVFDGVTIYNTLLRNNARVIVDIDGVAASIASIIAMAGDEVRIAENGFMMIHDPWIVTGGTADDLRDVADTMDKVRKSLLDTYMKRSEVSEEEMSAMMTAETWLNAEDALKIGLVDSVSQEVQMAAFGIHDFKKFKNLPKALKKHPYRNKVIRAKLGEMQQTLWKHGVFPKTDKQRERLAGMQQTLRKYGI